MQEIKKFIVPSNPIGRSYRKDEVYSRPEADAKFASVTGYVPYTGATADLVMGAHIVSSTSGFNLLSDSTQIKLGALGDVGLLRSAAGVLKVTDGSTGAGSLMVPTLIGGTAVGSKITYKSTTGVGTATGIAHEFLGGTDGGTPLMTMLNNGNTGLGLTLGNVKFALYDGGAGGQMGFGIQSNDFRFVLINSAQSFNFYATNSGAVIASIKGTGIFELSGSTTSALTDILVNPAVKASGNLIDFQVANASKFKVNYLGCIYENRTITAAGTTGNQTIDKPAGTVNIAASGTTVTVTNSLVDASSIIHCVLRTNDATATIKNVVPGAGSFVINLGAAATAEVSIGFLVTN